VAQRLGRWTYDQRVRRGFASPGLFAIECLESKSKVRLYYRLNIAHLITITTYAPKTPFLYPSFLELRNRGGNVSEQLA